MKPLVLASIVFLFAGAPAIAQQGPPPGPGDSPPPEVRERLDQARAGARTQAMNALSADHQAKVGAIVSRVKAGQLTDLHAVVQQIDAILSPKEAQAVLTARDKLMADLRNAAPPADGPGPGGPGPGGPGPGGPGPGGPEPGGPGPGGPGPGGPGPGGGFGGPPGGGGHGMRGMRNDAGFALLTLSLDREQIRSLFAAGRPPG
jgi:hypothetical protein